MSKGLYVLITVALAAIFTLASYNLHLTTIAKGHCLNDDDQSPIEKSVVTYRFESRGLPFWINRISSTKLDPICVGQVVTLSGKPDHNYPPEETRAIYAVIDYIIWLAISLAAVLGFSRFRRRPS